MIRLLVLVVLLFSVGPVRAEAPVILVVGDSLSAAYGIDTSQAWVALLQQRLAEKSFPHRVVNSSITGDTTRSGATRLPRALAVHQPTIVIIGLGGNDGLRGIPVGEIRANLTSMVEAANAANAQAMLISVSIPPNYGQGYRDAFAEVFRDLAVSRNLPLASLSIEEVAEEPGMLQADGIHPTAAAQPLMMERVWGALAPMLLEVVQE